MRILEVEHLSVELGRVQILHDVELQADAGELIWLVGPNGAGKSTLLRAVAGLLPISGEVRVLGEESYSTKARGDFAFAPDRPALYDDLTVAEHVYFTSRAWMRPESESVMLDLLGRFRLNDRLDEFPTTHSRGMRQKLSLVLCLGLRTPLVLLDEPYDGLDTAAQEVLTEVLIDRAADAGTTLMTSHQSAHKDNFGSRTRVRIIEVSEGTISSDRHDEEDATP